VEGAEGKIAGAGLLWERCGRRTSSVKAFGKVRQFGGSTLAKRSQDRVSEFEQQDAAEAGKQQETR
jgi:hypothetical protein